VTRRRRLVVLASLAAAVVVGSAAPAAAHPLGNFTINTSALVVARPRVIAIDYVVDMAEIPAFRERRTIDADGDGAIEPDEQASYAADACAGFAGRIDLARDGERLALDPEGEPSLTFPAGAGGLTTLRLGCRWEATLGTPILENARVDLRFVDRNFADAIGWREVIAAGDGATLLRSDVPDSSTTDRLRAYPEDALPLDVRTASLVVTGGGPRLASTAGRDVPTAAMRDGGVLGSLLGRTELTPGIGAFAVVVAFVVGAVHALGPGHGKTLLGAYLVGGGGTIRDAVRLGVAVSLMHTASVLALGAVVLVAERVVTPEQVYPWLGVAAGALALAVGGALLRTRVAELRVRRHGGEHGELRGENAAERPGEEHHGHGHPHGRATRPRRGSASSRTLVALAFSGGALPSPTALVVFLGAVSLGRAALGLALIGAFSVGLAAALVIVGALVIRAKGLAERRLPSRLVRVVPVVSAAGIVMMGGVLAARGVVQL
jgi:nickel/cobalt exporter